MTHPDQARVEGLIERLRRDSHPVSLGLVADRGHYANLMRDAADALSELLSLRASPSAGASGWYLEEVERLIDHACSLALHFGASGRDDVLAEYRAAKDEAVGFAKTGASTLPDTQPEGRVSVEYDGFVGDVIGSYVTREGKRGVVVQQAGTRVVHVYGENRVKPAPPPIQGNSK